MAHFRSSLFLLTCLACFSFAPSRGMGDRYPTALYNQTLPSASLAHRERSFPNGEEIVFAIAPVAAQEPSPKQTKPTSTPNQRKSTPDPKKAKASSSNSRNSQPLNAIVRFLLRQRMLFLLSVAALLVTSAAVFVLLKLVSTEPDNLRSKVAIARQRKSPRNRPRSHNYEEHGAKDGVTLNAAHEIYTPPYPSVTPSNYANENSDRNFPSIFDPNDAEPQATRSHTDNPDTLTPENHSNGYSDPGLNLSHKSNQPEPSFNNGPDILDDQSSQLLKINIVHQLLQDLAHPNPARRHKAIWELGDRGDSRAVGPLVDLLLNSDSKQHSLILSILSEIGIKTLKPMNRAWLISLQNENAEVRKNAIRDLTRIYELVNQVSHLLQRAADDPDPEVQETARWALNQLNRESSVANRDQKSEGSRG
ncbi:MAG TPA: HEAT repeat domain-containing protein [Kamptonema sp.]|nr:HEAT repeat domain-containing protein [Kamptonema sp.]